MTTKKAQELAHGDKITNCSSRVKFVERVKDSTMVKIHFEHEWAQPLIRFRTESVSVEG